jgi:hypothetical protein
LANLPIEVLTREETEKIVEEKIKKQLETLLMQSTSDIKAEIAKLRTEITETAKRVDRLSTGTVSKAETSRPLEDILKEELGQLIQVLEIKSQPDQLILRPTRYLGTRDFRLVSETVRRHGGFWSSVNRIFIVRKALK